MFFGRHYYLQELRQLTNKQTSSLVCILGRRRIGKSALVAEFAKQFKSFVNIQGLAPDQKSTPQTQLDHFAERLSQYFNYRKETFANWTEAFSALARHTKRGSYLILLDEISWMAKDSPHFAGQLKDAWDLEFKQNPRLVLVACGSVSSWIEENILKHTNFVGRVSLTINLPELTLPEINNFWQTYAYNFSTLEKILTLSVTGGVPKYLEEVLRTEHAEQNIIRLCFHESGMLYGEYQKIFADIFGRKYKTLQKIVRACTEKKLSVEELSRSIKRHRDGSLSKHIEMLELSGFVSKDYSFDISGNPSKSYQVRIKDNYLRFYLKYIEPIKIKLSKGGRVISSLYDLPNFDAILGYQFENLILANRTLLYPTLNLQPSSIISAAPYWQRRNSTRAGCQIDLLIHSDFDLLLACEFKCQETIDKSVVTAVAKKLRAMAVPKHISIKPVLVYAGEILPRDKTIFKDFFYRMIRFEELLTA